MEPINIHRRPSTSRAAEDGPSWGGMAASAPTPNAFPPHHGHGHTASTSPPTSGSSSSSSTTPPSSWGSSSIVDVGGRDSLYLSSSPASRASLRWSHQELRPSAQATLATRHATQILHAPDHGGRSSTSVELRQGDGDGESDEALGDESEASGLANGGGAKQPPAHIVRRTSTLFEKKKATRAAHSLTLPSAGGKVTVDVEELVADMCHPATGVPVRDRKWRLRTYRKCFVGSEAVDWLMLKLKLDDRSDALSVGQEIMRLQYFRHVVDDTRQFEDGFLFYAFLGTGSTVEEALAVRSTEELVALLRQPDSGLPVLDRKWHFKTYPACLVGSELVDWLMSHLPLRSRKEAVHIGNRLLNEGYLDSVVEPGKPFKDHFLFYAFGPGPSSSSSSSSSPSLSLFSSSASSMSSSSLTLSTSGEGLSTRSAGGGGDDESEPCLEDFELLKVLGVGAFGKVLMVRRKKTGAIYAMKALNKKDVAGSERAVRNLKAEKNILCNGHPFLVHLHYSFQTPEKLYLVMDYIGGGDLFFHLRQRGRFSEKEGAFFAAEVVLALEYLHSYGIVYRDLKPENVLFDKDGHVCLTDFGISKEIGEDKTKTLCGTPSYLAPEILRGEAYGESVDWWSLGVLVNEMVTGRNPFRSKNMHQTMQWIMHKQLSFPDGIDGKTIDFITKLLNRDARQRLGCGLTGAREVKLHPFLKHIDWADLAVKKAKSPLKINLTTETDTAYFSSEFTRMPLSDEAPSRPRKSSPASAAAPASVDKQFVDWDHAAPTSDLL